MIKSCKEEKEFKFFVNKWTKKNEKNDFLLGICGASITKIDPINLKPLSSYDLMNLKTIYTVKGQSNIFLLEYKSNRIQYFTSKDIKEIIDAIHKHQIVLSFEKLEPVEITDEQATELRERKVYKDKIIIKKHLVEKIKKIVYLIVLTLE